MNYKYLSPSNKRTAWDTATLWGICAAFGLVLGAILLDGGLGAFINFKSMLIVVGGTLGATLVTFPIDDFKRTFSVLRSAFFIDESYAYARIQEIVDLARVARNEGAISLESYAQSEHDSFFRKCIQLVADGVPAEDIRRMLELELNFIEDRHRRGAQLFQTMGTVAPAMGLVGTLIGLVRMLENLVDPTKIGPGMAIALTTTFYGALLAYVLFLPLSGKLRARSEQEVLIKELTLEGILCVAERVNPRLLEERLLSFLPPEERISGYAL